MSGLDVWSVCLLSAHHCSDLAQNKYFPVRRVSDGSGPVSSASAGFCFFLCVSGCDSFYVPRSLSDRASMFEFSESFNSYFVS